MRKIALTSFMLLIAFTGFCQTKQTKYYKNSYLSKETTQNKAKFSETTSHNSDGSVTTEIKNIEKNEITSSETYRGKEEVGVWKSDHRRGIEILDYNFELAYSDATCTDTIAGISMYGYFKDNDTFKYIAPKITASERTLPDFLGRNLDYPSLARENGIQGRVFVTLTITSEGKIENIVVKNGSNVTLAKEAVRVMRKLKLSSPPMVDGKPRAICVKLPITFQLD